MKCPKCGYSRPRGRPKSIPDATIWRMAKRMTVTEIANGLGISRTSVYAALLRVETKKMKQL